MTIHDIVQASVSRAKRWHPDGLEEWSPLEWAGAMAGEAGEACNVAKKIKRITTNLQHIDGRRLTDLHTYKEQLAKEAADTILYAMLLIVVSGHDPEITLANVFNETSAKYGFPEQLTPTLYPLSEGEIIRAAAIEHGEDPDEAVRAYDAAMKVEHVREVHAAGHNCVHGCNICMLFVCSVCGGYEGSLLPSCPGHQLTYEEHEKNYADYCAGTGPFEGRKR